MRAGDISTNVCGTMAQGFAWGLLLGCAVTLLAAAAGAIWLRRRIATLVGVAVADRQWLRRKPGALSSRGLRHL